MATRQKTGGRVKGTKNKATVARELAELEALANVPASSSKDARTRLEAILEANEEMTPMIIDVCKALLPYQHPKLSQVDSTVRELPPHEAWLKEELGVEESERREKAA